jgi:hypothetical protein
MSGSKVFKKIFVPGKDEVKNYIAMYVKGEKRNSQRILIEKPILKWPVRRPI